KGSEDLFDRKLNANDAGGTDENFLRWKAKALGSFCDGAERGNITLLTRGAVGVTRVDDYGAHLTFGFCEVFLRESDRSGDYKVLREDSCGGSGDVTRQNGEVERAGFFEAAGSGGEAKAFGEVCLGGSLGHQITIPLIISSPQSFWSSAVIAFLTCSGEVPPGTFFEASAALSVSDSFKSSSNEGENSCNTENGSSVQSTFCRSASFS